MLHVSLRLTGYETQNTARLYTIVNSYLTIEPRRLPCIRDPQSIQGPLLIINLNQVSFEDLAQITTWKLWDNQ